ncbi:Glucooligosaccharide oxidase [Daedalea quercina L-15889]|uniref:Glucooligosaccharide oxidase n=1 Tax=Daedalea quercina L-15889 TaxID=1314783 RepID=A0A165LPW9_9APHY|nr:Glucooligosaccharide oxidase [Daedalea quercina L-15889]
MKPPNLLTMANKLNPLLALSLIILCAAAIAAGSDLTLQSILDDDGIAAYFADQPDYQNASRSFNLRLPLQPVAVAYPNTPEEVARAVKAGASLGIPVSARSGRHSYAAYGLGGVNGHLVVDLSGIKDIHVDKVTGIAVIGAGNRLGDIAIALFNQAGRALPHGTCPLVGIGGHASYGGYGFTSRQWGLTLDAVIGATVVLANGTIVEASALQYPDLFWALRGAAPSFGIITHFHFHTFAAPTQPTFFNYFWSLPLDQAVSAISLYQNFSFSPAIPKEIGFELNLFTGTNEGEIKLNLQGSYYGSPENFEPIVEPFLNAMPDQSTEPQVNVTSWLENQELLAGTTLASTDPSTGLAVDHDTFYTKSLTTPLDTPMSLDAITALATWMSVEGWNTSAKNWFVQLELYGGISSQIQTVPSDATAYVNRNSLWTIQFYASSIDFMPPYPEDGIPFVDGLYNSVTANEPDAYKYGAYANYIDPLLTSEEWHRLYYGSNYDRLRQIKTKFDPTGVFTFPQSIPPL